MNLEEVAWPIADFEALAEALGGEAVPLEIEGRTVTPAELRPAMPAYYFPIGSEADLRTKLADAAERAAHAAPSRPASAAAPPRDAAPPGGGDCWS